MEDLLLRVGLAGHGTLPMQMRISRQDAGSGLVAGLLAGLPRLDSRCCGPSTTRPRMESFRRVLLNRISTGHHYVLEESPGILLCGTDSFLPLPAIDCPPTQDGSYGCGGIRWRSTAAREANGWPCDRGRLDRRCEKSRMA